MLKVQMILYLNLRLHKKNVMKQNTGLNCFLKQIVWMKKFINHYKIIAEQFVEC